MTEKIVQLPGSFWPSDTMLPEPEAVSRAELGLPADAFVFCCFNSNHKIRPQMYDVWMRLLRSVPGSVLWLRDGTPAMNERFRGEAVARGIDPYRIHFAGRMEVLPAIWVARRRPTCFWIPIPITPTPQPAMHCGPDFPF